MKLIKVLHLTRHTDDTDAGPKSSETEVEMASPDTPGLSEIRRTNLQSRSLFVHLCTPHWTARLPLSRALNSSMDMHEWQIGILCLFS